MPLISVVIPTYNRADLLDKAIASVLAQHGNDYEVVISDNCSTDQTPAVVEKYLADSRVRYSRNESNIGMVGNWKKAIRELATCEWFLLLSDDDYLLESDFLTKAAAAIRAHDPVFVYGGGEVHDVIAGTVTSLALPFEGLVSGEKVFASRGTVKPQDIILCSMVFRRADVDRLGFFDEPDNLSCDSEFYLKLCVEGDVCAISSNASAYIKHGSNLVSKINTVRRLRDKNLNHFVNPYRYAKDKGVSPEVLRQFRVNSGMDRGIASTLLLFKLHDDAWYEACRNRLSQIIPKIVDEIESSVKYRLKQLILLALRPYFRKKYKITDVMEHY
ncbi:MAG: glycosyltransferase family 2 protein [Fluviibacter sp.]